jgi:hypothetical protein
MALPTVLGVDLCVDALAIAVRKKGHAGAHALPTRPLGANTGTVALPAVR